MKRVISRLAISIVALGLLGLHPATAAEPAAPKDPRLPRPVIEEALSLPYRTVKVLGSRMTYLEQGPGLEQDKRDAVLFIHGNPTSAYLWRNVLPYAARGHRAIAVDLIGMGMSEKPDIAYTFADHYRYLAAFIDRLGLESLTIVGHDWGAALAWQYARNNPGRVRRLAFMEGVLPPAFPQPSFEAMGAEMGGMFRAFKDEAQGKKLVIEGNMFVEQVLPGFVNRRLGPAAMRAYRKPYLKAAARKPTLAWPREVPIAGAPAANVDLLTGIAAFMAQTKMPVLLAYAEPGALVPPQAVAWYVGRIANLETAFIGQGLHFIQEDQPDAIGRALADWMRRN